MDDKNRKEYVDDIRKEYEELRKEYIASQRDKSFVTLAKARSKKPRVDWRAV
jgi:5-methyltetrahydrofolate--homocysteine methyltransferase